MCNYFTDSRDIFKKLHPEQADLLGCCDFNQQCAAACFRKTGGYAAATVYKLGRFILARVHTGHLSELSCFQPVRTLLLCEHQDYGSNSTTLTKHSTSLSFPTGGFVTYVYSNNSSLSFIHPSFDLPIFLFKNRSVLCRLTVCMVAPKVMIV